MADIYFSLRWSEAREKVHLLSEALRKRGINSSMSDPLTRCAAASSWFSSSPVHRFLNLPFRWDRHADCSIQAGRHINEADLVVIIASELYGKPMRSHFGSYEELVLIDRCRKPCFIIRACDEVNYGRILKVYRASRVVVCVCARASCLDKSPSRQVLGGGLRLGSRGARRAHYPGRPHRPRHGTAQRGGCRPWRR